MNETIKVYHDSLKKLFTDEGFTDSVKNLELFETLAQTENEDMRQLLRHMIDYANDITVSTMQLEKICILRYGGFQQTYSSIPL